MDGGPAGAVIAGSSGANVLAFTSADGTAWRADGSLASATVGTVSGVTVTTSGAVVAAGASAAGPLGRQPTLTVDNAGRLTPVSFAGIPGALEPEVAVNSIAADGSSQVAIGSANGFPATWFSANAGTTWSRGAGAPASALNRPGLQELSGVVHGAAGWVAAGGVQSAAAQHPVVVTSAGGQVWQSADTEPAFVGAGVFTVAVAAGQGGYVIVGRQAVAGRTVAAAWWSAGLTGWQRGMDASAGALDGPGASRQMLAATANASGFVAVGSAGTHPGAWISANGRTWRAVTLALPMNSVRAQLQQLTINGRRIVAVGMSATSGGQTAPFTALSVNGGATWTESLLPSPGGAAAVERGRRDRGRVHRDRDGRRRWASGRRDLDGHRRAQLEDELPVGDRPRGPGHSADHRAHRLRQHPDRGRLQRHTRQRNPHHLAFPDPQLGRARACAADRRRRAAGVCAV